MANTYTQIHIHAVFAVQGRESLIIDTWKDELYKYISGIICNHSHKPIIINGMPDHIHILIGMRPNQSLSDLLQDIKGSSSKWINKKNFIPGRFSWQEGFGAFSYGKSQIADVINYISNQEYHHKKLSFHEEYLKLLRQFEVEFKDDYIFKSIVY